MLLLNLFEQSIQRRSLLAIGAAWGCLPAADTPRPSGEPRVIYLGSDDMARDSSFIAMRQSLQSLAALRGTAVQLHHRLVHARLTKAEQQQLVADTIDHGCNALIAPTADTALAAAKELHRPGRLQKPPVLFSSFADPVGMGIVPSLQRPGGRITGVSLTDTWHGKRLELLREAFAHVKTVGILLDSLWAPVVSYDEDVSKQAVALGLDAVRFDADTAEALDQVMHSAAAARMDSWYIPDSYISWLAEAQIIEHIRRLQRPAIHCTESEVADGGALMAYAADRDFVFDALADLTLRVLRGEDPGSIPIQRPRRFVLAVRPRPEPAALRIHPSVVRRADRVY